MSRKALEPKDNPIRDKDNWIVSKTTASHAQEDKKAKEVPIDNIDNDLLEEPITCRTSSKTRVSTTNRIRNTLICGWTKVNIIKDNNDKALENIY